MTPGQADPPHHQWHHDGRLAGWDADGGVDKGSGGQKVLTGKLVVLAAVAAVLALVFGGLLAVVVAGVGDGAGEPPAAAEEAAAAENEQPAGGGVEEITITDEDMLRAFQTTLVNRGASIEPRYEEQADELAQRAAAGDDMEFTDTDTRGESVWMERYVDGDATVLNTVIRYDLQAYEEHKAEVAEDGLPETTTPSTELAGYTGGVAMAHDDTYVYYAGAMILDK